jgi:hypothetical protein
VLVRIRVAGRDPGAQAAVLAERQHVGAALGGDRGRAIGRPVVDEEHVGRRQSRAQLVEDLGEALLLVPGRDEDDGGVRHLWWTS